MRSGKIFILVLIQYIPLLVTSQDYNSFFTKGLEKYNNSEYNEAIVFFEKADEKTSGQSGILYYKGLTFFQLQKFPETIFYMGKAVKKNNALRKVATEYMKFSFKRITESPDLVKSGYVLNYFESDCDFSLNYFENKKSNCLDTLQKIFPNNAKVRILNAIKNYHNLEYNQAESDLDEVSGTGFNLVAPYYFLYSGLLKIDWESFGLGYYTSLFSLKELYDIAIITDLKIQEKTTSLMEFKRVINENLNQYDEAIKLKPDYADAYFFRAKAKTALCRYAEALDDYNKFLELCPSLESEMDSYFNDAFKCVYFKKALIEEKLNMTDAALEDYKKARLYIQYLPESGSQNNYSIRNKIIYLLTKKRKYEEVLFYLNTQKYFNAENADEYYFRWKYMAFSDKQKEAFKEIDEILLSDSVYSNKLHCYKGRIYSMLKNYDDAIREFKTVLTHNTFDSCAYYQLARIYISKKNYLEAHEVYNKAFLLDDNDITKSITLVKRAALFNLFKQYDNTLRDLNDAVEISPDEFTYNNRAIFFEQNGQYENAIKDFTDAFTSDSSKIIYLHCRAQVYIKQKKYDEALMDYWQAIHSHPYNKELRISRGKIYKYISRLKEASEDFQASIEIAPADPEGYYEAGLIEKEKNNITSAYDYFIKAISKDPLFADAHFEKAMIDEQQADYDQAIKSYTKAIELNFKKDECYFHRGVCKFKSGDKDDALYDLRYASALENPEAENFIKQINQ